MTTLQMLGFLETRGDLNGQLQQRQGYYGLLQMQQAALANQPRLVAPVRETALVLRREVQPAPRRRLEWTALAAGVIALLYMLL